MLDRILAYTLKIFVNFGCAAGFFRSHSLDPFQYIQGLQNGDYLRGLAKKVPKCQNIAELQSLLSSLTVESSLNLCNSRLLETNEVRNKLIILP